MCGCETYDCVEVYVNPCNAGTELNIIATETASWNAQILFNGKWSIFAIEVTEGEKIILPTLILNENYTHEFRLTNSANLTTCYWLKTAYTDLVTSFEPVPPANDVWQWGQVVANGMAVDDELLTGDISPIIWINEQPMDWVAQGVTQTSTGLLFPGGAYGTLIFQYKNIP